MKKLLLLLSILFIGTTYSQGTIYVDSAASGANNGSSWTNAFANLQNALSVATQGSEIWIAKGTYYPTTTSDRSISFVIPNGVSVYGNFAGNETNIQQRGNINPNYSGTNRINETILSGDIGVLNVNSDNSNNIIYINNNNDISNINGVLIELASSKGVYSRNNNAIILQNNIIRHNYNGGVSSESDSITIENNTIRNNTTTSNGGGIYCSSSIAKITENNIVSNVSKKGGGIHVRSGIVEIENNAIRSNNSSETGGGISVDYSYNSSINNNSISSNRCTNSSSDAEGGGISITNGKVFLNENDIRYNEVNSQINGRGAGLFVLYSEAFLTNNVISYNSSSSKFSTGIGCCFSFSTTHLKGDEITGNYANNTSVEYGYGAGISCGGQTSGNNSYTYIDSVIISANKIILNLNVVPSSGGGGIFNQDGFLELKNSKIFNNKIETVSSNGSFGGGISCNKGTANIINCLIFKNSTIGNTYSQGGGAYFETYNNNDKIKIINSTIVKNTTTASNSSSKGGGVFNNSSGWSGDSIRFFNTIFNNNTSDIGEDYYNASLSSSRISFNNSILGVYVSGANNLIGNPDFVDEIGNDYRLNLNSIGINAGENSFLPSNIITDLGNKNRFYGSNVDIGAYENQGEVYSFIQEYFCVNYNFNGQTLTSAGTYYDTINVLGSYDSIITLDLFKRTYPIQININESFCEGGTYSFNGIILNASGTYYDTIITPGECDTLIKLNLSTFQNPITYFRDYLCTGVPYNFNGKTLTTNGLYYDTLQATSGCDSIIRLELVETNVTPSINITSIGYIIYPGTSVTFTATAVSGGNSPAFQWKLNGIIIAGETSNTFTSNTLNNNDIVSCELTSSLICVTPNIVTSNEITISTVSTVNNDIPCSAVPLAIDTVCDFSYFDNNIATTSYVFQYTGDPSCQTFCNYDVWLSFVAPPSGSVEVNTQDVGIYNAVMAIYSTPNCSSFDSFTEVDCDDNGGNGYMPRIFNNQLIPGNTYYISISGFSYQRGVFGICIKDQNYTTPQPLANDNCSGAIMLTQNASCITTNATTINATKSMNGISCGNFTGDSDDDVWFSFVANSTNPVIEVMGNNGFDAVVDLRTGGCNGVNIDCADAYSSGREIINTSNLIIGETYYVRVYDYGSNLYGNFTICVHNADNNSSIKNITNQNLFKIYPNPSNGIITIQLLNDLKSDGLLTILDYTGKEVYRVDKVSKTNKIDLSYLSNGTYQINLYTEEKVINSKLILLK